MPRCFAKAPPFPPSTLMLFSTKGEEIGWRSPQTEVLSAGWSALARLASNSSPGTIPFSPFKGQDPKNLLDIKDVVLYFLHTRLHATLYVKK
jgi:hypothetical protein